MNYLIFLKHLAKFQVFIHLNLFLLKNFFNLNLDIRVYKDYLFVQYDRIDDARTLIKEGQANLILKGNKLGKIIFLEIRQKLCLFH